MPRLFLLLFSFFKKNQWLGAGLLFTFLITGYLAFQQLEFRQEITDLIPKNKASQTTQNILNTIDFRDKIVLHIYQDRKENKDSLVAFAESFLEELQAQSSGNIQKIQGRVEDQSLLETYHFVYDNLPFFLDENDYTIIEQRLAEDSLQKAVKATYDNIISPIGFVSQQFSRKDPLHINLIGIEKLQEMQIGKNYQLYQNYLLTKDEKNLLLFINPVDEKENKTQLIIDLKKLKEKFNLKFQQTQIDFFGAELYAYANEKQIKSDITTTVSIALLVLFLLLTYFYRSFIKPILLFLPTLLGAIFALIVLSLFKGTVSLISLGIGAVLLGITLDYSLHIFTHFRENKSIENLYKEITKPILTSSITTAIAFLCLLFINSEALTDLGVFTAVSVLTTAFFALILIPQFLVVLKKQSIPQTFIDDFARIKFQKQKWLLTAIGLAFLIGLFFYQEVDFQQDISKLNYQPIEVKQAEDRINAITENENSLYVVSYGKTVDEALISNHQLYAHVQQDSSNGLKHFSSIGGVVLSEKDQLQKIEQWTKFWDSTKVDYVKRHLIKFGSAYGFKENIYQEFYQLLEKEFKTIKLGDYQQISNLYLDDYIHTSSENNFATVVSIAQVEPSHTEIVKENLEHQTNVYVLNRKGLNESLLGLLQTDFNRLITYSFIAVLLILWLALRQIELVILTVVPIAMTWVLSLSLMYYLGISFNILNIIISTFIFGLGVDYSIFITSGLQEKYTNPEVKLKTYKTSILLSVITTLLGIGVLIFAKHPALHSVATISIIGVGFSALIAMSIQPFLFALFITKRANKGLAPLKLFTTVHSLLSFLYFGLGALLVSLFGRIYLRISPQQKQKKLTSLSWINSKLMGSVLRTNPFVKQRKYNISQKLWEKPAVFIANHASFLDILSLGKLNKKQIFLVNDWVYNSPIFGKLLKEFGFLPTQKNLEDNLSLLQQKISEGYSLIVFPEGSRSKNNKINRFHKGAFYLAEQLGLPIIPVIIHGTSEALPKNDFIIYGSSITLNALPKIKNSDLSYGNSYSEKTKFISKYFKREYQKLKNTLENEKYFKKYILHNFLYTSLQQKIKKEYEENIEIHLQIAKKTNQFQSISIINDYYGLWTIFYRQKFPFKKIHGSVPQHEDLKIAKNRFATKHLNLKFDLTESLQVFAEVVIFREIFISELTKNAQIFAIVNAKANFEVPKEDFELMSDQKDLQIYQRISHEK
ncbi:MMPL family transporter [Mesonia sp. K7]|uniref:MMPL family transporter n=1 Tax=Mesonia sp. K7 TaxID=2218606 RepID=UPI000DA98589|nr:MMPL family transporter [Mesonia sp. K7]PZD76834.1 glycerol acyltransferase [Mesonia sp. K7]